MNWKGLWRDRQGKVSVRPRVTVVCQYDDSAIYVDGWLLNGGDNKLVNGAIDLLKKLKIKFAEKYISYDIWKTEHEGWPKALRKIKDLQ